ncbi:MAG: Holliday junction branch migration protein RuvA [Deltaproteobacteria bacterium]|nr:Holliday junction branch migration protein RuvA [Deltaproteobacteria bacterium]MBI3386144.1 Holliday junction branch migration protein RuvA [Deltaproteobacteria bacterium]
MIAQLSGTLAHKSPEHLVVDVGGVGYQVFVSLNCLYQLPNTGERVRLLIHTNLRENALELFGFAEADERQLFGLLIGVSGIGPRLALNILSGMPVRELQAAIESSDLVRLVSIPGIGKKTAERLVVELRDRVKILQAAHADGQGASRSDGVNTEAVSALVNLGYRRPEAEHAVKAARADGVEELSGVIRDALRRLSG